MAKGSWPKGRQRIVPGVYYTMRPARGLAAEVDLEVKWYGYPLLAWKHAHENYQFRWHQYPWLVLLIIKHTILHWLKGRSKWAC